MKIVFHDVDGCLNSDAGTAIPIGDEPLPANQTARLKELGRKLDASSIDHFVINTGRSIDDTLAVVESIASHKLRYVIAEHGAVYRDVKVNENISTQGLLSEKLVLIRSFIDWYRATGSKVLNERIGTEVPILDKVANLTLDARNGLDSQLIYDVLQDVVRQKAPFDYKQLVFHHSETDGYVDAMGLIDKGDGVETVTALLACAHKPTMNVSTFAIGNGLNDMPMLNIASMPVCPANAEAEVREYCLSRSGFVSKHDFIDATFEWLDRHM